ncbi:MAG TPA: AbrB/MazE/SpoVT family DNA-binding domain-containing protein [Nitrososphaeraceae archaeon]|jgi:AbrB family looped-hinge helix DNA binding protein|nr:AbrB/MazE/SpoVT family DNA-binding domain-containing protein [Nitrososphaeraceae archaeon]
MSAIFEGKRVKWGTSVGMVIPKPIRDGMRLDAGDKIRLILSENKLCIEKIEKKSDFII